MRHVPDLTAADFTEPASMERAIDLTAWNYWSR
jgi:hypothetical protein